MNLTFARILWMLRRRQRCMAAQVLNYLYNRLIICKMAFQIGVVVVVIVWSLDLQPHVQSVPITTNIGSSWRGVLDTTLCDKVCQWLVKGQWFSLGTPASSTNTTDRHDVAEMLLKVALDTINLTLHRSREA